MQYVLVEWDHDLDDEPYRIYSELDDSRCEGALNPEPVPEDLRDLRPENGEGDYTAREISPGLFYEVWNQAQERPDGFMGIFF